jgi:hypothetical protein
MRSGRTVLAVVLAVAAGAWAAPVQANPPATGADELFAVQHRLVLAADAVTAAAGTAQTSAGAGLAGISAKPERGELWVYWKGAVPAAVKGTIDGLDVPARLLPARYSKAELLQTAQAIAVQPGVTAVGPLVDGSGLRVSTTGTLDALENVSNGVPLVAKVRRPAVASRQVSAAPHYGGAKFLRPAGRGYNMCTTGFAIWQGRLTKKMLTAGHCADNGDTVYSGDLSTMGTISGDDNTKDTMLINTSSAGRIYVDGYSSNTSKPVHMALGSYVDTLVCTSGAMTGEHCKIRVIDTDLIINVGYLIYPVVEAIHDDDAVAAGLGDSGGPVVAQDSWGPFGNGDFVLVYATGTITAIDLGPNAKVPCGQTYAPTECSDTLYYVDIMDSQAYYGGSVVTG